MIDILGWFGTALILLGTWLNADGKHKLAMFVWIIGDAVWITYDIIRGIYPHLGLSGIVIILNSYGIYKILKSKNYGTN